MVPPPREWICNVTSRLQVLASRSARKRRQVITSTDSAVQRNDFELIPTIRMVRGHSADGSFSRHFSSMYIVRELSPDAVGSRSRGSGFWEVTNPCGKILKILFRKDSPCRRTTSCEQISWNLADWKSVKSCVIYLTKKNKKSARTPALASAWNKNLSGPAPDNILGVPQISSKSVHFRRSYSRTRERRSNAPQCSQYSAKLQLLRRVKSFPSLYVCNLWHLTKRDTSFNLYT